MKLLTRLLTRFWGYIALAIAIAGFFLHSLGYAVILVLSLAALGYFLVQAPVWCCAVTRKGELCRNNSHGLLLGCSIRQHKWQRTRQTFTPTGGRAVLAAGKSASGALGLIGGVVAGVQVLIAAGGLVRQPDFVILGARPAAGGGPAMIGSSSVKCPPRWLR